MYTCTRTVLTANKSKEKAPGCLVIPTWPG